MPLYINASRIDQAPTVENFVKNYPHFKDASQDILNQDVKVVGPKQLLYIGQREVAGTSPVDDVITILGSEDATTCHIAVMRHTGSGATSMIHFDGCSIAEGLESMISIVLDLTEDISSGRLECHLFGGFLDDRLISQGVSNGVLEALCLSQHDIHLVTACITHINTVYKNNSTPFPVIYGIGCDVKTGEIYRASFPNKGPDLALRSARHFSGGEENIVIYDHKSHELVIGPFHYEKLRSVEKYLALPNHLIRKYLSTSPEQEPEGFEESVRASLKQMIEYPDPLNSVFKGQGPKRYHKDLETGSWISIN